MKALLFLPLIFFLTACDKAVEEVPSNTTKLVDEAMEVFIFNKEILEDEVIFGTLCLVMLTETGTQKNETCEVYNHTKEQAITMSAIGLDIFTELIDGGYLAEEKVFFEVIDIVERLAMVEQRAKRLRREIEDMAGSKCIKCAM